MGQERLGVNKNQDGASTLTGPEACKSLLLFDKRKQLKEKHKNAKKKMQIVDPSEQRDKAIRNSFSKAWSASV